MRYTYLTLVILIIAAITLLQILFVPRSEELNETLLLDNSFKYPEDSMNSNVSESEAMSWALETREAMRHIWSGYKEAGFGSDEVKPVTGEPSNNWGGLSMSVVDSLSTLWLMDMKEEFNDGVDWLANNLNVGNGTARGLRSTFEITIRVLGGLVSAFDLSERPELLIKSRQVGDLRLGAFSSDDNLFQTHIDMGTGECSDRSSTSLSQAGSMLLEFTALSRITNDPKYQLAAQTAMNKLMRIVNGRGIVGHRIVPNDAVAEITVGAEADSYYEYLLKGWLQTGRKDETLKTNWIQFTEALPRLLKTSVGGRTFAGDMHLDVVGNRMQHLSCFVGGNLILGARTIDGQSNDSIANLELMAKELTRTCMDMYTSTATGLGPEISHFNSKSTDRPDITASSAEYILRPEAIESAYYMHYFTNEPKYLRWGKRVLDALNKHCKVQYGYSSIRNVNEIPVKHSNKQETFMMAETLKYLYLLFSPKSKLDLNKWVLNTEAHPVKISDQHPVDITLIRF